MFCNKKLLLHCLCLILHNRSDTTCYTSHIESFPGSHHWSFGSNNELLPSLSWGNGSWMSTFLHVILLERESFADLGSTWKYVYAFGVLSSYRVLVHCHLLASQLCNGKLTTAIWSRLDLTKLDICSIVSSLIELYYRTHNRHRPKMGKVLH